MNRLFSFFCEVGNRYIFDSNLHGDKNLIIVFSRQPRSKILNELQEFWLNELQEFWVNKICEVSNNFEKTDHSKFIEQTWLATLIPYKTCKYIGAGIISRWEGTDFQKNSEILLTFFLGQPNWFSELDQNLVYGAFRKILGSVRQKWKSQNSSKGDPLGRQGVESLRGGGHNQVRFKTEHFFCNISIYFFIGSFWLSWADK